MNTGTVVRSFLLLAAASSAAPAAELLVPAYFYPGGPGAAYWSELAAAGPSGTVTAIMNPGNGPGPAVDPNYVAAVDAAVNVGVDVVGYVYTSYGSRALATVLDDIDTYAARYPVHGIFVDEMSNVPDAAELAYYGQIYAHVKALHADWTVIGNPGTTTDEAFLTTADTLVVFEGSRAGYATYAPAAWNALYPAERFAHLVYAAAEPDLAAVLATAAAANAGYVFVTDDVLSPNPWDTLPAYFGAEVAAQTVPVPVPVALFLPALAVLRARRRSTRSL